MCEAANVRRFDDRLAWRGNLSLTGALMEVLSETLMEAEALTDTEHKPFQSRSIVLTA